MQARGNQLSRGVLTACLVVFVTVGSVFGQQEGVQIPDRLRNMSVPDLMKQGSQLVQEEEWSAARPYFLAIIQKDTSQASVYAQLSEVEYSLFNLDVSQKYIRQAIEIEPDNDEYRARFNNIAQLIDTYQGGLDAVRDQDYEEALNNFDEVLQNYPGFAPALFNKGVVYRAQGNTEQAVNFIEQAIEADPDNQNYITALSNMAKLHFKDGLEAYQRGNLTTAEEEFKTALQIDPDLVNAQYMLGVIARRRGNTTEAIDRYQATLEIDENYERAWVALGIAYESIARDKQALNAYQRATEVNPNYARAWTRHGLLLNDMERYAEAVPSLQKAIQIDPSSASGYEGLGMAYMRQGKYQQAVEQFTTAIGLNPQNASLNYRLSDAYHELGNYQEMVQTIQEGLQKNPDQTIRGGLLVNLGDAQCHLGNTQAALDAWQKATAISNWREVAEHRIEVLESTGECE